MRFFGSVVCVLLLAAQPVLAQVDSDVFHVRVFGSSDSVPPTTPTLLTVDPIAYSQIDLTWSSSTDNFVVGGYSVIRDGTPIATTTQLSYSDSGLSASTTYTYTVRAFDGFLNYSSSSNSIATTTPDMPLPPAPPSTPTSTPGREVTAARVVMKDLQIIPGLSTTSIEVETAYPARIELRWGRSASYELGYIVSSVYSRTHSVLLTDLEPGTVYEYEIVGYTQHGQETVLRRGHFMTISVSALGAPPNVGYFTATQDGYDVDLSWVLPASDRAAYVRVVRSHFGFPTHPQDGAVVYQGTNNSVRDVEILSQYSPVYYSAFVFDAYGNVSSGAVAVVYAVGTTRGQLTPTDLATRLGQPDTISVAPTSTVNVERVTPDMQMPELTDVWITQATQQFTFEDPAIVIDTEVPFTVTIPADAVAGNLKSIILTITDPTDNRQRYSYLLRINHDQSAYETVVMPLGVLGRSQLILEIYDYEAFVVATYQTPFTFTVIDALRTKDIVFPDILFERPLYLVLMLAFLLLLALILVLLLGRRRQDEDNADEV